MVTLTPHGAFKQLSMIGQNNFKFVPLYGKADATCFQRKPQRKMQKIGIFFIYYENFINL